MREPLLHGSFSSVSKSDSWFGRVVENLRQLLAPSRLSPTSANGAPIHVLKLSRTGRSSQAQTFSFLIHAAIIIAISLVAICDRVRTVLPSSLTSTGPDRLFFPAPSNDFVSKPSLGRAGGGGENDPVPATHGFLAPHSSIQLAQPRLPDNLHHELPVPVAILDADAPPVLTPVPELGLPWMPRDTDSAGPGKLHGIGTGERDGMGDRDGPDGGFDKNGGPYTNGFSMPVCSYCPLPIYSDEARHVKMQGTVTLRVLVGADGRASEIRVVREVGYGLDERAVETVRTWKFKPARDAAQRPVAAWVVIEAVFRLF